MEKPLPVTPIGAAAAVVVHELAGLPAVDEEAPVGTAPSDGDVDVAVDGEEDEVPIGEAEGVGELAEGLGVVAVGEPEGDGGREEEGARGGAEGGEVGEVELDDAVVEVMGAAEDVEVGSPHNHVEVAQDLLVALVLGRRHGPSN